MKILELENEPLGKLRAIAKSLNIPNANRLKKETLAMMIREAEAQKEGIELRGGILDVFNTFSGGALERFSLLALNVMPYISASIILQLLTVVSPSSATSRITSAIAGS